MPDSVFWPNKPVLNASPSFCARVESRSIIFEQCQRNQGELRALSFSSDLTRVSPDINNEASAAKKTAPVYHGTPGKAHNDPPSPASAPTSSESTRSTLRLRLIDP